MSKILIVDDEESIRYTFKSFLADEGHEVVSAPDYDAALDRIRKDSFDLIFMDIVLGGKSGIDLLGQTKRAQTPCPVVMITGYPNLETSLSALRLGAFDYIFKPVRQETLLHTANKALQYKRLHDENEKNRSNLEAIFRSVKDAIITVDSTMIVIAANEAAEKICGITRSDIGKPVGSLPSRCSTRCLEPLQKTIAEGESVEILRTECNYHNGHRQVVTITTSPLIDSRGRSSGAIMVVRDETRLSDLERDLDERRQFHHIIGQNRQMQKIYSLIDDLADVQTTVLITGESGTGKELVAEAIHAKGKRSSNLLVKVNCSALSESLLESELFGHVRGAFTGADRDKAGRFEKAHGGTIFLDEIGDISPRMQLRLLRVLQEKVIERVGDSTPIKVDVRVIAATNQDLSEKVKRGQFREDLYYRLKVVELALPPLRNRKDDIPLLIRYFIEKFNRKFGKSIMDLSDEARKIFMDYSWPGNIRELEHVLEHVFVTSRQRMVTVDQLPANFPDSTMEKTFRAADGGDLGPEAVTEALRKAGGNKSKAARLLGVNVRTIYRKIDKYNIETEKA